MENRLLENPVIIQAIENANPEYIAKIVIGNEPVFRLCLELKKVLPVDTDPRELGSVFDAYYEKYKDMLEDECGYPLDYEDAWDQFLEAWPKVTKVLVLQQAVELAKNGEIRPELQDLEPKKQRLGMVCYHLQKLQGFGVPFFLSSYNAAQIVMGNPEKHRQALRLLNRLCQERILELHESGNYANLMANTYLYIGHLKDQECPTDLQTYRTTDLGLTRPT